MTAAAAASWPRRVLFLVAAILVGAFGLGVVSGLRAPGRRAEREAALSAGKQTLGVLALLEERRRQRTQRYTENLVLLSTEADDPPKLLEALPKALVSESITLNVDSGTYRISAQAQDPDHTWLEIAGPVAAR